VRNGLIRIAVLTSFLAAGGVIAAEPQPAPRGAGIASTPAGTSVSAPRYRQAPGSTLTFSFEQAGAASQGAFKQFTTTLAYDEKNLAGSSLNVNVQMASLDTQDQDRDTLLAGADLFDTQKYPAATFVANALVRDAKGRLEAAGKLTLRGVTRDLRIPLVIKPTATGLELTGETSIKRLDFGVGQGEWSSTEWVGDTVKLNYKVVLTRSAGEAQ
jgi:polyisoprenoid-binding protein YceI